MQDQLNNIAAPTPKAIPSKAGKVIPIPTSLPTGSPEIRYALQCASDKFVARQETLLYCWNGNYWKVQSNDDNGRHALLWLSQYEPKRATAATAESCVKTAVMLVQPLPPKSDQIIIPVKDAWLRFTDENIVVVEPDPAIGISYRLAVNTVPPLGDYMPALVPHDSLFWNFLTTSLPDAAVRQLVQEYVGYTLTDDTGHQCAQLWVGSGSNGKSVMLNIVRALHERTVAMRLDKLDGFDLVALIGASLATCDETPKLKINQQALKSFISGGATQITGKYAAPVTYRSSAKWVVCANHVPAITDHSDGWWRRWHVVQWGVQFKGSQIIPNLDQKIIQHELHIVLDWALAGLQRLIERGEFVIPASVTQSLMDAKTDSNSVTSWIVNNGVALTPEDQTFTDKSSLYQNYDKYCHANGYARCNQAEFFKRVIAHFPGMKENRQTIGVGTSKTRPRRVNLTTGVFSNEDFQEQAAIDQAEINTAFGYN